MSNKLREKDGERHGITSITFYEPIEKLLLVGHARGSQRYVEEKKKERDSIVFIGILGQVLSSA